MVSLIHPMHVSVRHPAIIATLKVQGWKECSRILNLNNYAACIYGAEQKHHGLIAADGQGHQMVPVLRQKSPARVPRRLRSPSSCQLTFNLEKICCMLLS